MLKEILERKVLEQDAIVKALKEYVKHLNTKVCSSHDEIRLQHKAIAELIKKYGEVPTVL